MSEGDSRPTPRKTVGNVITFFATKGVKTVGVTAQLLAGTA
jgi:hypothetical protein